jgi:CelD/BcsL family acetyltransferase involved in cellulose biosynthesis
MKASICRPSELGSQELDLWRSFQRATDALASPFLSPEFALVMGAHRPDISVAVLEDGGRIAGFFTFERRGPGLGRSLCYGLADNQALVHAPGYEWSGAALLEACRLAMWEFDHLVGDQVRHFAPQDVALKVSPIVDLSDGWQSWIARKSGSKRIKKIRAHERKLVRELGQPRVELTRDTGHLQLLTQWKSAQYRRTGRFDRFARAWLVDAVRRLFEIRSDGFSTELSAMFVRDRPVSLYLCLRSRDQLAGWFPAYDIDLASYGVGIIHQLHLLMHASRNGVRFFDCGAGEESYKRTFSDLDITLATGALSRNAAIALAHRIHTAPARMATEFVLRRPQLRRVARKTLLLVGKLRSRLRTNWERADGADRGPGASGQPER